MNEQQANYPDLDPAELDRMADKLDALCEEFGRQARKLRTLSLRQKVAQRRLVSKSVSEKVIADGYVSEDLTCKTCVGLAGYVDKVGWPYTPVDYPTVDANAASGEVGHYRADGTLSHTTVYKPGEE